VAAFPAAIVSFLAEPILRVWVGSRIDPNGPEMHAAVVLMRILLIGVVAMCLRQLVAGPVRFRHIQRYTLVMVGASRICCWRSLADAVAADPLAPAWRRLWPPIWLFT
jgi:hypothetical protein